MYTITRQQASQILWISTRSIDRYIKSGKIRAKKIWKIVYLNKEDIDILSWKHNTSQEIIIENKDLSEEANENESKNIVKKDDYEKILSSFDKVFNSLREEIKQKDEKIQILSVKLWRMEEIVKNSVNLIDYKKSQFLLEESKNKLNQDLKKIEKEKQKLENELKYERTTNKLLIFFVIVLLILAWFIWFYKI